MKVKGYPRRNSIADAVAVVIWVSFVRSSVSSTVVAKVVLPERRSDRSVRESLVRGDHRRAGLTASGLWRRMLVGRRFCSGYVVVLWVSRQVHRSDHAAGVLLFLRPRPGPQRRRRSR